MSRDIKKQVAISTPFDNLGINFSATNVQDALNELSTDDCYASDSIVSVTNGTHTILETDFAYHFVTGTGTNFSIQLPDAMTIPFNGRRFTIFNTTNQPILIKNGAGTILYTLGQNSIGFSVLQEDNTVAGTWINWQQLISSVASGVISYNIISSTAYTTSTRYPTFSQITGFTVTPQAGTYSVWYNASSYYTTTPKAHWWAIYKNTTKITDSERRQDTAHSNQTMMDSTQTIISCDGTESISIYVSCDNTGTLTVNSRSLILIRLGT